MVDEPKFVDFPTSPYQCTEHNPPTNFPSNEAL